MAHGSDRASCRASGGGPRTSIHNHIELKACCTRSSLSPVTDCSDARSLCAQFCVYPCSRMPQWTMHNGCSSRLTGTLATLCCGECAGHLFASQLQRTAEKRYTQVSRKSRSRATSTGAEDGRPLSSSAHSTQVDSYIDAGPPSVDRQGSSPIAPILAASSLQLICGLEKQPPKSGVVAPTSTISLSAAACAPPTQVDSYIDADPPSVDRQGSSPIAPILAASWRRSLLASRTLSLRTLSSLAVASRAAYACMCEGSFPITLYLPCAMSLLLYCTVLCTLRMYVVRWGLRVGLESLCVRPSQGCARALPPRAYTGIA